MGKATPHSSMLQEMGRDLLIKLCIKNCIGFWNKLVNRPACCILYKAAKENILQVRDGWCSSVISMIYKASGLHSTLNDEANLLTPLPQNNILQLIQAKEECDKNRIMNPIIMTTHGTVGSMVRGCPDHVRSGYKSFKYDKWFADSGSDAHDPVVFYVNDVFDIRILSRFRCGMHWLATEKDRLQMIGRSGRLCRCCRKGEREDELHLFFCDAYEDIRNAFPIVFRSEVYKSLKNAYEHNMVMIDACMNAMMNVKEVSFIHGIVGYLRRSVRIRDRLLLGDSMPD